jgi:uncharacterized protein involved in copper resistance
MQRLVLQPSTSSSMQGVRDRMLILPSFCR